MLPVTPFSEGQGFSRVMDRPAGQVRRSKKLAGRIGSGVDVFENPQVGSGWVGSDRVRRFPNVTDRVVSDRVGSGLEVCETSQVGSGRVGSGRAGSGGFQMSWIGSGRVRRFPKIMDRVGLGRVGSDLEVFEICQVGSGGFQISRTGPGRVPDPAQPVKSPDHLNGGTP